MPAVTVAPNNDPSGVAVVSDGVEAAKRLLDSIPAGGAVAVILLQDGVALGYNQLSAGAAADGDGQDGDAPDPGNGRGLLRLLGRSRIGALETELEATRTDFEQTVRGFQASHEESRTSIEAFKSSNEELQTSQKDLKQVNDELFLLNAELQKSMEAHRAMADDLKSVLYSTDFATLFLDADLNIRFFTPATTKLFNLIAGDIGRPLTDLSALSTDENLTADAREVLRTLRPAEREIASQDGAWLTRRILPYRTHDNTVQGVVITFADITDRKRAAEGWEEAKRQADVANKAKSRFLAAASHDLRQPLQTLALLHGMLAKTVVSEKGRKLVSRLDETLGSISGMLNVLLDINQIEAGAIQVDEVDFSLKAVFASLREEFSYHAQAQGLRLSVVPCDLTIHGDPRLLEQMIRNLLANALKYTSTGKVLLGCRRRAGVLSIEIWDTGIGIPADELHTIFDEYRQLDNMARERSRGLGLGLSIVQRLGNLLGYRIAVDSRLGSGSAFKIELPIAAVVKVSPLRKRAAEATSRRPATLRSGSILVVEDDPDVRDLLRALLEEEGHRVATASDGPEALRLIAQGRADPDLVLADYNLPNQMDGLSVMVKLREKMRRWVPGIVLTGDISTQTASLVGEHSVVQINKPVKAKELADTVQALLAATPAPAGKAKAQPREPIAASPARPVVFLIDDDPGVCAAMRAVLEGDGKGVVEYHSAEAFLADYKPGAGEALVLDANLPGMSGLALLERLGDLQGRPPTIVITGRSGVSVAVQAMKAGAVDFIEKPVTADDLLRSVARALAPIGPAPKAASSGATAKLGKLTPRQRQIMDLVLEGAPSKNIAADLNISQRTVENHRAAIMRKMGAASIPALARIVLAPE